MSPSMGSGYGMIVGHGDLLLGCRVPVKKPAIVQERGTLIPRPSAPKHSAPNPRA